MKERKTVPFLWNTV